MSCGDTADDDELDVGRARVLMIRSGSNVGSPSSVLLFDMCAGEGGMVAFELGDERAQLLGASMRRPSAVMVTSSEVGTSASASSSRSDTLVTSRSRRAWTAWRVAMPSVYGNPVTSPAGSVCDRA